MKPPVATRISFQHLDRLTSAIGLHEHALLGEPRIEHGYCVDDAARGLVLLCREPELERRTHQMLELYLDFTLRALADNGSCHNRMDPAGIWVDDSGLGDWWGRAMWGLGFAAVHAPLEQQRERAIEGFRVLARGTSPDLKSISFAALGAGELLLARPDEMAARRILTHARLRMTSARSINRIWPEPRFTYSNGSIPEASILIGMALIDRPMLEHGISQLEFLLANETRLGRLSVTPAGGRDIDNQEIGFDQQPIEVAAIADACARAWRATGEQRWMEEVQRAWSWFLGNNDVGVPMFDSATSAGYDGLHARGPNLNQGAESTISMLTTAQQARAMELSSP